MDACTYCGSEHTAHADCTDGGDELVGFVVSEGYLTAALNADEGVGVVFLAFALAFAAVLCRGCLRGKTHHEGRDQHSLDVHHICCRICLFTVRHGKGNETF